MRFLRDHDGEFLPAVRLIETDFDFHTELLCKLIESGANFCRVAIRCAPRSLKYHAELATRDLFFERLDVGLLLEKKIRDAGDDTGFVAPDDGDSGKLFHGEIETRIKTHISAWKPVKIFEIRVQAKSARVYWCLSVVHIVNLPNFCNFS